MTEDLRMSKLGRQISSNKIDRFQRSLFNKFVAPVFIIEPILGNNNKLLSPNLRWLYFNGKGQIGGVFVLILEECIDRRIWNKT